MNYFLISVSNRKNLELCVNYALAGFTNSINGLWTFSDIQDGDYISFLYGARAYNLYLVEAKEAIRNAQAIPPWDSITFKMSGLTYYFPFSPHLTPVRKFSESLVRAEFAYVAENLLLRGGYRKTHFQADQTTLQSASQLGELHSDKIATLDIKKHETFIPRFTKSKDKIAQPEVFRFFEIILQSIIRQTLSKPENMDAFLHQMTLDTLEPAKLEVLGEKALAQGHIDIMIKEAVPLGLSRKIVIEVKTGLAKVQDIAQLNAYIDEIGNECVAGVIIAKAFPKRTIQEATKHGIIAFVYKLEILETETPTFNQLKEDLHLARVN